MLRGFLSLLVGLFAAMIVNTFVQAAGVKIWPPGDLSHVQAAIDAMPVAAKATVVAGWLLGAFAGGLVTTLVARHRTRLALVPGVLIAILNLANAMTVPLPEWMSGAIVLGAIPMAWLGARLGVKIVTPKSTDGGAWTGGTK